MASKPVAGEVLLRDLFENFGVLRYHANGVRGQHVKIMIIDTGMRAKPSVPEGLETSAEAETDTPHQNVHGLAVRCLISPPANTHGMVGIAPDAEVQLVDVYDPSSIPIDLLLAAMRKGMDNGVDIMSISLGTNDSYEPLQTLIDEAAAKGVLVFAAAGNSGSRQYEYPASCFKAISVASINSARQPSEFNTRNDSVVLFAPGEAIRLPTGRNGNLEEFTGTSFATPFAAGVAALVLSEQRHLHGKDKKLTRREMVDILRDPQHFNLNCDTHTYVMDRTCTNYEGPADHERSPAMSVQAKAKLQNGVFVLLTFVAVCLFFILKPFLF